MSKQNRNVVEQDADDREDVQDDAIIGKALLGSIVVLGLVGVIVGGIALAVYFQKPVVEDRKTEIALPQKRAVEQVSLPKIPLADITAEAGIDWKHVNGMEGEKLLPETMGGGVAVFDFDRDGDNDLLFVGGTNWPWAKNPVANPRSLCIYRNDGTAKFTDVTAEVGLERNFYGCGPAVGDFDNDGWPDLFVSAVGKNVLYKNNEGKFTDVSESSGIVGDEAWSSGAVWFDYDNDGKLDLFVCHYVLWSRELDLSLGFSLTGLGRAFGQPTSFTGTQSLLYHNEGDGKFKEVSKEMGIQVANPDTQVPVGKGLGVAAVDVNRDGWMDIVVANDTVQNFLFMNRDGKSFQESGIPMGVAFDRAGNSTGAMGLDCGYLRNDDSLAIAIGNFANEPSSLYISRGPDQPFFDAAMASGLGPQSRLSLTFGMFFADLDLDGRQDIVCSNGHLEEEINKVQSTQEYAQAPQYFWNAGSAGSSELVALKASEVGEAALKKMVGRAAAYGDLDGDGDVDIILVGNGGPARILRNDQQLNHNWLRLKLEGSGRSNRDAAGALVTVKAGGVTHRRCVTASRSYLSQCELAITFGLGKTSKVDEVIINWPDGQSETLSGLEINRQHQLRQGETR
ncbi:MAG: CRTAC1 family protein [Pirellulaceae bacterium]|nr:CRTAC1 family protein [Pirellulaceae bacterium]